MRQAVSERTLQRWSRRHGLTFVRGLHRGGPSRVLLVTDDHHHYILNPMSGELTEEADPRHWTSCPG